MGLAIRQRQVRSPAARSRLVAPLATFALHSALIRFSRLTANAFTRTYHPSSKTPSENRGPRRSMQPLSRCALPCPRMAAAASCGGRCCRCESSRLPNAHCFRYSPSACFLQFSRVRSLAPVLLMRSLCPPQSAALLHYPAARATQPHFSLQRPPLTPLNRPAAQA